MGGARPAADAGHALVPAAQGEPRYSRDQHPAQRRAAAVQADAAPGADRPPVPRFEGAGRHRAASAARRGCHATSLLQRVDRYAREIVPAFNAYLYFRVGYWLAKTLAKLLYRVRLGYTDTQALAAVNPKSSVVFVMNHRSNMDYVLVAFLAAERVALSYAVGEWARIWPLQQLIRSMGAYFVRRNSGDPLYRTVLAALRADGGRGRRAAGGLSRRRAVGRRQAAPAAARAARLHAEELRPRRASAISCSYRWASTTTACSRTARCCASSTRQRRSAARSTRSRGRRRLPPAICG